MIYFPEDVFIAESEKCLIAYETQKEIDEPIGPMNLLLKPWYI